MKLFISIIAATSIMLSGLTPAYGFSLPGASQTHSVNSRSYSFGDRYIYNDAGSGWNYDSAYKYKEFRYHRSSPHNKYWLPRFEYTDKSFVNDNIQGLVEHFSKARFHITRPFHPLSRSLNDYHLDRIKPYHPVSSWPYNPACR